MSMEAITKALETIEQKLAAFSEKAEGEIKVSGDASRETKAAIEKLGHEQKEIADRLLALEQKGATSPEGQKGADSIGAQFTKADGYKSFAEGAQSKVRIECKNTVTGSDVTVAPDRKPGVVGGAFRVMTIEDLFPSLPTSSNAVEYTRENVFTNNAAEAAEGTQKAESAITFTLENKPISTVAHFIKISRQLAMDAPALAAYINTRMIYGVNLRVENQLVNGDGIAPNIDGLMKTGNFTLHGYLSGALGDNPLLYLIRKVIADCMLANYPATGILLNPADWATIELTTDSTKRYIVGDPNNGGQPKLWGLPVIQTAAMTADKFLVGAFNMAGTIYNREGVVVELSEHDSDNFQKNLITIRAERRLQLAVERPASLRGGDLTPPAA